MPTILILKGYRFFFYSSDVGEPPHVHVEKGDAEAKIWLIPEIKPQYFNGFKTQEKKEILEIIHQKKEFLKTKWNEYFK